MQITQPLRPTAWLYLLGTLLLVAAFVLGIVGFTAMFRTVFDLQGRLVDETNQEVGSYVCPGKREIVLDRPGLYVAYQEQSCMVDGRVYRAGEAGLPDGVTFQLARKSDGKKIPLNSPGSTSTSEPVFVNGEIAFVFDVDQPDTYTLTSSYPAEANYQPSFALTVQRNADVPAIMETEMRGGMREMSYWWAGAAVAAVAGIVVLAVTYSKRSAYRRELLAAAYQQSPPPPPGPGPGC